MERPKLPYAAEAQGLLRNSILDAVDELVRRNGWVGTSMARVAGVAGVSRQTVYNEFGSRQAIAQAYINRRLDKLLDSISKELTSEKDLADSLYRVFELFFELVDEPLIQTVIAGGTVDGNLIVMIRALNERATEQLSSIIKQIRPELSDYDALVYSDAIARLAAAHAAIPTLSHEEAINRMVRLSVTVLNAT
jgi:AcrR family transcriptional regulator